MIVNSAKLMSYNGKPSLAKEIAQKANELSRIEAKLNNFGIDVSIGESTYDMLSELGKTPTNDQVMKIYDEKIKLLAPMLESAITEQVKGRDISTGGIRQFGSEQDAISANLPVGTKVMINGRRARIK